MTDISLLTIDELIVELKTRCSAMVASYHCYDEDLGSKRILTKRATFETYKAQALGLSSRLYWWLKRRSSFNGCRVDDHIENNNNNENNDGDITAIIQELDNRCPLFLFACVVNGSNTILLHQKDGAYGQSLGIAYEMDEWMQSLEH